MALTLVSFFIFLLYLALALRHIKHVPQSLSETFYLIGGQPKCYLFTATLWVMLFTLLPVLLEITPDSWKWLAFLALAGIGFVGAAPFFHDSAEGKVHTVAAIAAAVFGLAWTLTTSYWYAALALAFCICMLGIAATDSWRSARTWWLEMAAFGSVYFSAIFEQM